MPPLTAAADMGALQPRIPGDRSEAAFLAVSRAMQMPEITG